MTGHEVTGTRRHSIYTMEAGDAYGDNARGTATVALYLSADGSRCVEVAVYPVLDDAPPAGGGELHAPYGVDESITEGMTAWEDGEPRPDDAATISYEPASANAYADLETAQSVADRIGQHDLSWCIDLREPPAGQ